MDNNIPDWKGRTALATTDNYAAGKIAGEYLKTVLKDGDTLGILEGVPGVPSLDDRVNGMLEGLEGRRRSTSSDAGRRTAPRSSDQRRRGPADRHVRKSGKPRATAIDRRITRHAGYPISQVVRKRVEEIFGWGKTVGGLAQLKLRGLARVKARFILGLAAYNLVRLPKLLAASP